jgi:thiol-disulfide isomerase/thioredoxin
MIHPRRYLLALSVLASVVLAHAAAQTPSTAPSAPVEVPSSRGGQDLVGTKWPDLAFDRWITADGEPVKAKGSVTLYRWWTNTCPYCESSLPALEKLRQKYGQAGLEVVAVYHPKPPRDVSDDTIRKAATRIGFNGPVAVDTDWSELKRLYLDSHRRSATSASFLVDRSGIIRFVHPGPDLFPSDDPLNAQQDRDYRSLEKAVQALLAEQPATPATQPARPSDKGAPAAKAPAPSGRR